MAARERAPRLHKSLQRLGVEAGSIFTTCIASIQRCRSKRQSRDGGLVRAGKVRTSDSPRHSTKTCAGPTSSIHRRGPNGILVFSFVSPKTTICRCA